MLHPFTPTIPPVVRAINKAHVRREFHETKLTAFRDAYWDAWSYQTRCSNFYMSPAEYKAACVAHNVAPDAFMIFGAAA